MHTNHKARARGRQNYTTVRSLNQLNAPAVNAPATECTLEILKDLEYIEEIKSH